MEKGNLLLLSPVCLLASVVLTLFKAKPQTSISTESTACTAISCMLVQLLPSQGALVKRGPELFVLRWCLPFRVSECCGWETTKGKKPEEEKKTAASKKTGNKRKRGYQRKPWRHIACVTTWPLCLLNLSTAVKESLKGSEPRSLKVFLDLQCHRFIWFWRLPWVGAQSMLTVYVTVRRREWRTQGFDKLPFMWTVALLLGAGEAWGGLWTLQTFERGCVKRVPPSTVVVRGREVMDPPSPLRAQDDEGKITGWSGPKGTVQCHPLITAATLTYGAKERIKYIIYCTGSYIGWISIQTFWHILNFHTKKNKSRKVVFLHSAEEERFVYE